MKEGFSVGSENSGHDFVSGILELVLVVVESVVVGCLAIAMLMKMVKRR